MIDMDDAIFEDIQSKIKTYIRRANNEIKMCVAWINFQTYAAPIKEALDRGVNVEIIYNDDAQNSKTISHLDSRAKRFPIKTKSINMFMHNKFCIIDNEVLINGSYNWSNSARNHFENIIILHNKYKIIKRFLHEFEELKYYNKIHAQHAGIKCMRSTERAPFKCNSSAHNIIIIGNETGTHQDTEVETWKICKTQRHAQLISTHYEQYLFNRLGFIDSADQNDSFDNEKEKMIHEFEREARIDKSLQEYFNNNRGERIHAIGRIGAINEQEHIQYGEPQEYGIQFLWKDIYYRKEIPDIIYEEEGEIEKIVIRHRP